MKKYEGMFILNPDMGQENEDKLVDSITKSITKNGGNVTGTDKMGKRNLAYPIKKFKEGVYYKLEFEIEPKAVSLLKKDYKLKENIVRKSIIVKE